MHILNTLDYFICKTIFILQLEDSPYLPQESFYELYNSADFCRNGVLYGYRHSNDVITSAAVKLSVDIIDQNSCQNMIKRKFVINKTSLICGNATDGLIEKVNRCQNYKKAFSVNL